TVRSAAAGSLRPAARDPHFGKPKNSILSSIQLYNNRENHHSEKSGPAGHRQPLQKRIAPATCGYWPASSAVPILSDCLQISTARAAAAVKNGSPEAPPAMQDWYLPLPPRQ